MKNRSHAHEGRLRLSIRCPACGSACLAKHSSRVSDLTRQYSSLQCVNDMCGWTGAGVFEITHTVSPTSKQFDRPTLPPLADAETLEKLKPTDGLF